MSEITKMKEIAEMTGLIKISLMDKMSNIAKQLS